MTRVRTTGVFGQYGLGRKRPLTPAMSLMSLSFSASKNERDSSCWRGAIDGRARDMTPNATSSFDRMRTADAKPRTKHDLNASHNLGAPTVVSHFRVARAYAVLPISPILFRLQVAIRQVMKY